MAEYRSIRQLQSGFLHTVECMYVLSRLLLRSFIVTGANPESYELPYLAMSYLIDAGVSCNACLMASFSDNDGIRAVKRRLSEIAPGILQSLEIERIKQFPKVRSRLNKYGLKPNQGVSCVSGSDPTDLIAVSSDN